MTARASVLSRLLRRLRPRRRLRLTREGRYFLFITLAIGLAAVNTGNNLLYLLLGWLLSVIVASGAMSDMSLRGLRVHRRAPPRVHAGRPFVMELAVDNTKRRLSAFSIEVEELVDGRPVDKRCYFLKIPPGTTQRASYRHTFLRRGLHRLDGFRVRSKYPFGLFVKSRDIDAPGELLVYPEVRPMRPPAPRAHRLGETTTTRAGRHGEFFALREYRAGDDRRAIHWRSTARRGALMVREFEQEAQRRATVLIDNALPVDADDAADDALEEAITIAASLAAAYLDIGYAVALMARGAAVPGAAGPAHLTRVLGALALLARATDAVPFRGELDRRGDSVLVVPRGGGGAAGAPAGVGAVIEATVAVAAPPAAAAPRAALREVG
jgi:uncharacterized protein (DUF58 family)